MKRVLELPDPHLRPASNGQPSGEDVATLNAVLSYASKHRWDEVVILGDMLDLDCISDHNHGKPRLVEGKRLQRDFDHAKRFMDQLEHAVTRPGSNPKITLIEGNHDFRIERYIEAHPESEGLLELDRTLELKERGWNWVRYWSKGDLYHIGNLYYGHGRHTNRYHAQKHLDEYGVCLHYGHVHDVQEFSRVHLGDDKTLCAKSMGCLCRYNQPWLHGRPTKWQQAFGVTYFQPNGFFNDYCIKVFDHSFTSPEGERYGR